jgi:hypothetical protein
MIFPHPSSYGYYPAMTLAMNIRILKQHVEIGKAKVMHRQNMIT